MKLCIDLRFKKNNEGKLILQAKWQPIQFSGTYALQLAGEPTDFEDVDLANDVLPTELTSDEGIKLVGGFTAQSLAQNEAMNNVVEEVTKETLSKEEKDAVMKSVKGKKN